MFIDQTIYITNCLYQMPLECEILLPPHLASTNFAYQIVRPHLEKEEFCS